MKTLIGFLVLTSIGTLFAQDLNLRVKLPVSKVSDSAKLKVILYGKDRSVADAPANVLRVFYKQIKTPVQEFSLAVESELYRDIDLFGSVPMNEKNAVFYVVAYVDMNGDGLICSGDDYDDYQLDYNQQGFISWNTFPTPMYNLPMEAIGNEYDCDEMYQR